MLAQHNWTWEHRLCRPLTTDHWPPTTYYWPPMLLARLLSWLCVCVCCGVHDDQLVRVDQFTPPYSTISTHSQIANCVEIARSKNQISISLCMWESKSESIDTYIETLIDHWSSYTTHALLVSSNSMASHSVHTIGIGFRVRFYRWPPTVLSWWVQAGQWLFGSHLMQLVAPFRNLHLASWNDILPSCDICANTFSLAIFIREWRVYCRSIGCHQLLLN